MAMTRHRPRVCDLSLSELSLWFESRGEAAFRAEQVWRWLFQGRVDGFAALTNLPPRCRGELESAFELFASVVVEHHVARDRTEKLLLELHDGERIECVLMREPRRRTVCLSTQVGCAMGCVFCASGLLGLTRNLSTGEILEQVLRLDRLLSADEGVTNVVVMGLGEPLANLPALIPALEALCDPRGLGLSPRRITISTVGLPAKIRELAELGRPFNLAVSLHAPEDRLRNELVPVNDRIGLREILAAADDYFERTGRRVTFEYVLLAEINDRPEQARQLAALVSGRTAHVNVIPMNVVESLPYIAPSVARTRAFVETLNQAGVTTTIRTRKGDDIDAACGQLRLKREATAPR